jgi:hypothetical protein
MSAQAALTTKHLVSAVSITGTALAVSPRGKDPKGVLSWVYPGATTIEDIQVDFSYRPPTATRKTTKATLRAFVPKTYVDSTTSLTLKAGDNIASCEFTFPENATAVERTKLVDMFTSALGDTAVRLALNSGDVMY